MEVGTTRGVDDHRGVGVAKGSIRTAVGTGCLVAAGAREVGVGKGAGTDATGTGVAAPGADRTAVAVAVTGVEVRSRVAGAGPGASKDGPCSRVGAGEMAGDGAAVEFTPGTSV